MSMLTPRQRFLLLAAALLLTLGLVVMAPDDEPQAPAVEASGERLRPARAAAPAPELRALSLASLSRAAAPAGTAANLFPVQSWYVPPPPPKPAPPAPPPLPFTYLGKLIDGEQVTVFVSNGNRNLVLKNHDVIDGTYQVDAITPPVMRLTYLPLQMQQTMNIGGAN
ncbi:hypothetical protein ACFOLG_01230 [Vogesella facilis]|uniref:Secretion system X translation initiation factor n=1 Tax=Vogesella facilis TaxID=1655232 RepID=A0ABV7RAG2_9NEIS